MPSEFMEAVIAAHERWNREPTPEEIAELRARRDRLEAEMFADKAVVEPEEEPHDLDAL